MAKERKYMGLSQHLYSNFFAPRGNERMIKLGKDIADMIKARLEALALENK